MRTKTFRAIALVALGLLAGLASADEMIMKNGSRLIGTVVSAADGKISFDTEFAGTISVDAENVDTLFTDKEVTVMMNDGRVIENQKIVARDDTLIMMSENMESVLFEADDMKRLNPDPWELGRGYKWSGEFNAAMMVERGNTDTDETDISGSTKWRSLRDRYSMDGYYELDKTDGIKNKNKWRWINKYDRFSQSDPDNYWGILLAFEGDEFSDLDLRTRVGPYIGRQFFESKLVSLSGEVGLVWVDEQLDPDPPVDDEGNVLPDENDYPGSVWALDITSDYFGGSSNFFIKHDGTVNFDDSEALLLNTTIGVSFDLYKGLQAGVEARFEYDGGVADDVDEMDETYNMFLGYKW
jgi:hypothetical protein